MTSQVVKTVPLELKGAEQSLGLRQNADSDLGGPGYGLSFYPSSKFQSEPEAGSVESSKLL